jgi:alkylation response protein AidB-like acyl-CoA dehydrogenase
MSDYKAPLQDIGFVLDHLVDLDELCQLEAFKELDPVTLEGVIEENARFVQDVIAPLNHSGDQQGSVHDPATNTVATPAGFTDAYQQFVAGGWGGVPFPAEYGGGGFPWLIGLAMQEVLSSANMSFSMCPLLTQGAIDMLLHHGSEEQREVYLPKMVTGEWTGTMNLTEPQAGSDVGALTTKAVPAGDGSYRITGQKIFITFGDHDMADNVVHLVLARVPDAPPGTKGISCFLVPKVLVNEDGSLGARNDVQCVSIEHKMGIKASPTCVMAYGDGGEGAIGYLIGEENEGMRYMFTMMNNARLSVGLEGLSIAERAYQDAVAYARERRQGRAVGAPAGEQSLIVEHADVRRMLLTMKASIEAVRALLYVNAEAIDLARHHIDPGIREAKQDLVELLTPISKAWSTDVGIECTSLAIQVYGGMGFIEEAGVAQHYRDARITAIYEGTNGIQAMDLVTRKLPLKGGEVVKDLLTMMAAIDSWLARYPVEFVTIRASFDRALTKLVEATAWIMKHGAVNAQDALAGSVAYLRMFGLTVGGWLMARQALAARDAIEAGVEDPGFYEAKIATARFFAEQLLPLTVGLCDIVQAGSETIVGFAPERL